MFDDKYDCLMMIMTLLDDYDFNDDDLIKTMNSYMHSDDDFDDDRTYEMWRCLVMMFSERVYLLSHMFMHHKCQVGYLYLVKMIKIFISSGDD